jgi:hypothetical protein
MQMKYFCEVNDPKINASFSKQTQVWGGSTISPAVSTPTTFPLQYE